MVAENLIESWFVYIFMLYIIHADLYAGGLGSCLIFTCGDTLMSKCTFNWLLRCAVVVSCGGNLKIKCNK